MKRLFSLILCIHDTDEKEEEKKILDALDIFWNNDWERKNTHTKYTRAVKRPDALDAIVSITLNHTYILKALQLFASENTRDDTNQAMYFNSKLM